jgi:hypothetical protein
MVGSGGWRERHRGDDAQAAQQAQEMAAPTQRLLEPWPAQCRDEPLTEVRAAQEAQEQVAVVKTLVAAHPWWRWWCWS